MRNFLYIKNPLKSYISLIGKYQNAMVSIDRFYEYYDQAEEASGNVVPNLEQPIIFFDKVNFSYNNEKTILIIGFLSIIFRS